LPIHFAAKYFKTDKHVTIGLNQLPSFDNDNTDDTQPILKVADVKDGFSKCNHGFLLPRLFSDSNVWNA